MMVVLVSSAIVAAMMVVLVSSATVAAMMVAESSFLGDLSIWMH